MEAIKDNYKFEITKNYIINPLIEKNIQQFDEKAIINKIENQLNLLIKIQEEKSPANKSYCIDSLDKQRVNPLFYCGTGGNVLMYKKLFQLYEKQNKNELKEYHKQQMNIALQINLQLSNKINQQCNSFLMSSSGFFTIQIINSLESNNNNAFNQQIQQLLNLNYMCFQQNVEYELLYGISGYLYCLLLIQKTLIQKQINYDLSKFIYNIIIKLYEDGLIKSNNTLQWSFPFKQNHVYLGAAHGTTGIIYMMIKGLLILQKKNIQFDNLVIQSIKNTVDLIQLKLTKSGNLPSSLQQRIDDDNKVQFCHGAPGAVSMFLEAFKYFGNQSYMDAALKNGECIWNQGLLLKGNGLCHGITGNAYFFISIFKNTQDEKWKQRCFQFAEFSFNQDVLNLVKRHPSVRKNANIPDYPYSLMEGIAGDIIFYADLLLAQYDNYQSFNFPAYEL